MQQKKTQKIITKKVLKNEHAKILSLLVISGITSIFQFSLIKIIKENPWKKNETNFKVNIKKIIKKFLLISQ